MNQGIVTESPCGLIPTPVEAQRLVVCHDPERIYAEATGHTSFPNTMVAWFEGGFLKLRDHIDCLLNDLHPRRLVVNVPMDQAGTDHALIEFEAASVVQQPPACYTRLSLVARNAFKPILGDENAAEVEKRVEAGKLDLANLDFLASKGQEFGREARVVLHRQATTGERAGSMTLPSGFIETLLKQSEGAKRPRLAASTDHGENEGNDA